MEKCFSLTIKCAPERRVSKLSIPTDKNKGKRYNCKTLVWYNNFPKKKKKQEIGYHKTEVPLSSLAGTESRKIVYCLLISPVSSLIARAKL